MDLKNPILDERQKEYIETLLAEDNNPFHKKEFLQLYKADGIDHFIKDIEGWVTDTFFKLGNLK